MNSLKWISSTLKNLRISGSQGGQVIQARSPPLISKVAGVPEKPVRPLPPYIRFSNSIRNSVKKENPNLRPTELVSILAQKWKELSEDAKEGYKSSFKDESEDYRKAVLLYQASLSPEQIEAIQLARQEGRQKKAKTEKRKTLKELGKPKRPPGPFILYVQSLPAPTTKTLPSYQKHIKECGLKWAAMSDEEKKPYVDKYNAAAKLHENALKQWESKMIKQGLQEFVREKNIAPSQTEVVTKQSRAKRVVTKH